MTPRILVTGGTGLLGSYLLRWFRSKGYDQLIGTYQNERPVIPHDLQDGITWRRLRLPDLTDAFDVVAEYDWVIHSAALISYFKEDKFRLLEVNQKGTEHIVNACIANGIKHLVYVGSIGALGKESKVVTLNETNPWLDNKYSTSYGLSKYLGELEVWRGAAEGLKTSVILPSVILGTGDWQRSSLQLIDRVANHSPYYPGGQTGYVDVRDVVRFIDLILEKSLSGERWIISGANMKYDEIYGMIAKELSLKKKFTEAPKWLARILLLGLNIKSGRFSMPEVVDQVYASFTYDTSKSKTVEGFRYTPMEDTIRDVIEVYRGKKAILDF